MRVRGARAASAAQDASVSILPSAAQEMPGIDTLLDGSSAFRPARARSSRSLAQQLIAHPESRTI